MGYYVRAFCSSDKVPSLRTVLEDIQRKGINLRADDDGVDLESNSWDQVALIYKEGKLPILMECTRDTSPDCLFREEIDEFVALIGKPGLSFAKRRIIGHLKNSKYIVACQLPTSDIDDDGYNANGELLRYFLENHSAIIQADGEGFYEGEKLVVEMK